MATAFLEIVSFKILKFTKTTILVIVYINAIMTIFISANSNPRYANVSKKTAVNNI